MQLATIGDFQIANYGERKIWCFHLAVMSHISSPFRIFELYLPEISYFVRRNGQTQGQAIKSVTLNRLVPLYNKRNGRVKPSGFSQKSSANKIKERLLDVGIL